ncbi:MAG: hypothetical protein V3T81_00430 [Thermoanaerobaculia bacterium]
MPVSIDFAITGRSGGIVYSTVFQSIRRPCERRKTTAMGSPIQVAISKG